MLGAVVVPGHLIVLVSGRPRQKGWRRLARLFPGHLLREDNGDSGNR
jgi:hypothetical protein